MSAIIFPIAGPAVYPHLQQIFSLYERFHGFAVEILFAIISSIKSPAVCASVSAPGNARPRESASATAKNARHDRGAILLEDVGWRSRISLP